MQPNIPQQDNVNPSPGSPSNGLQTTFKPPRPVFETIFAFPPNRDTLGGTAYLILENTGNLLIDCPAWNEANEQFLRDQGGISCLFLTHRGGMGQVREIQAALGCSIVVQEQEAYLLPGLEVTPFQHELALSPQTCAIWTPGHSPGSSCLYYQGEGGVLFSGRHLLPNRQGEPVPLRTSKTFHWQRQIQSVKTLLDRFTLETLHYLCPGANTGALRGKGAIAQAYHRLAQLNLDQLLHSQPWF